MRRRHPLRDAGTYQLRGIAEPVPALRAVRDRRQQEREHGMRGLPRDRQTGTLGVRERSRQGEADPVAVA